MNIAIKKVIVCVGLLLGSVSAFAEAPASSQYFAKLDQFGRLTTHQLKAFKDYVSHSTNINPADKFKLYTALEYQERALWGQITKLKELYDKSFNLKTATREERQALVSRESNLSIAIHRQLLLVHEYLTAHQNQNFDKSLAAVATHITTLSNDLQAGKPISVPASMGINQVFQASRNLTLSICKMISGFCTRKSMSNLMDSLDETRFLRNTRYQYEGHEVMKETLAKDPKAIFILIGNHDQPLMDIALARKVALLLGSDQHITMTRKSVYPIPPPQSAGDVVFVVDNDPKSNPVQESLDILEKNIRLASKSRVSLAVYPEGMLPYTGGQMPMTVKEGAFVIARKMAVQMKADGIPVYLVQMKTNIIEHLTSTQSIPAKVVMESLTKVPDTDLSRNDPWVESMRIKAENSFNSHRAQNQIDIFNLDKVPLSKIPYGMEMRVCSRVFIL